MTDERYSYLSQAARKITTILAKQKCDDTHWGVVHFGELHITYNCHTRKYHTCDKTGKLFHDCGYRDVTELLLEYSSYAPTPAPAVKEEPPKRSVPNRHKSRVKRR